MVTLSELFPLAGSVGGDGNWTETLLLRVPALVARKVSRIVTGGSELLSEPMLHPTRFTAIGAHLGLLVLMNIASPAVQLSDTRMPFASAGPRLSIVIE